MLAFLIEFFDTGFQPWRHISGQYRNYLLAIQASFLVLLHTVHSLVKGLRPINGINRIILNEKFQSIKSSSILMVYWVILIVSIGLIAKGLYNLYFGTFIIALTFSIMLCRRYLSLASATDIDKKFEKFEKQLKKLKNRECAMQLIFQRRKLIVNILDNSVQSHNFSAVLARVHHYMEPESAVLFVYFGMLYFTCSLASKKYLNETLKLAKPHENEIAAFALVTAKIFTLYRNVHKNFYITPRHFY